MSTFVPLALSTPAWAGLSAVFGALIGAVAGACVDAFFGWRRESALAKAGARLVAADLSNADSQLRVIEKDQMWWRFHKLPMTSWEEYRNVLAIRLGNDGFEAVSQAVMGMRYLGENMEEIPGFRDPTVGSVRYTATLTPLRHDAAKAYNALAKLAGHDRVGEVIHPAESR